MTICRICERTIFPDDQQALRVIVCHACSDALTDELARPPNHRDPFYAPAKPQSSPVPVPVPLKKSA